MVNIIKKSKKRVILTGIVTIVLGALLFIQVQDRLADEGEKETQLEANNDVSIDLRAVNWRLRDQVEVLEEENLRLTDANWQLSEALQKQDAELQELKDDAGE